MIQKDDLINGGQHFVCHNEGNVLQAMSFEDLSQQESTLPPVSTVLPQYYPHQVIPTPPPSDSPSPQQHQHQFQLQHQHQTIPQHNQNMNYMNNTNPNHLHPQPIEMVHFNQMFNTPNMESTYLDGQLLTVDHNSTYTMNRSDLSDQNNSMQRQNVSNSNDDNDKSVYYVSDGSTVDAEDNENLGTDEPFTYLQNLNSDNLMKFSQQSALLQLMEEQMVETKSNLNSIPICEEHDNTGYDFRVDVNCSDAPTRRGVYFSKESQRLYIKTNENVYINCSYKVKMPIQPLNVRVLPIYSKDSSIPVLRCQNHISKDTEPVELIRNSLLRCENPDATYYGDDVGKAIKDRYSVVVPLNATIKASDNHLKQQLILNFTCNNSCMNRKETSVIFILETQSGDILAQRVLSVKISTCPKRDKRLYEGPSGSFNKRRPLVEPDFCPSEPKMAKYDESCVKEEFSRSSYDDPSDDDASGHVDDDVDVHVEKETGDFVLTLKYKNRQQMLQTLRVLYSSAITNEVFYKSATNSKKMRDSENLRRGYEKALRLKGRHTAADCT